MPRAAHLRTSVLFLISLALPAAGRAVCRDCAESALGGPAENRFVHFDSACSRRACRGHGFPQVLVNTVNLNLHVRVADLILGGDGLRLERSYNGDDAASGPFGARWNSNLGETLSPDSERKIWVLRRGSGRVDMFAPATESGRFFALTRTADRLAANADGTYTVSDPRSRVVRVFRADGLPQSFASGALRVTIEYDGAGRLAAARAAAGALHFEYEGDRVGSVTDSAGRRVAFTYTPEGKLARQLNADGRGITYEYDDAGRLAAIAGEDGATRIAYGSDPDSITLTLPDGATRRYESTGTPGQVRVTDGSGDAVVYASNAMGLTESVTDAAGNRTAFVYDAAGRRTRATNANGETTRFDYNANGDLAAVTDAAGNRWTAEYDTPGSPARLLDARGNLWQLGYEGANLSAVADPLSAVRTAGRNSAGRITSLRDANGNTAAFEYTPEGLLATSTDALGASWHYGYDGAARPVLRTEPNGRAVHGTYDERNRLCSVTVDEASATLDYGLLARDALNRVIRSADSFGNEVHYGYDAGGRLARVSLPAGEIRYGYDSAGRLARVSDWLGNFAFYSYDAAGSVQSVNVSGGPVTIYQYDAARRLRALVSTGPDGAVIAAWRYTHDADGNRISVSAVEPLAELPSPAAGTITYDAANRPVARDDGSSLRYDDAGRLAAIEGPSTAVLSWDPFGRLLGFRNATFRYDETGLRVERGTPGEVRRFVYDRSGEGPRLLAETDGGGRPLAWYVHGLGLLWKIDATGKTYFFHADAEGNVAAVSTSAEGVVNRYRYDPLGRLAAAEETVANRFRARGEAGWMDDGDGLLYSGGTYSIPEWRLTLGGTLDLAAPAPDLTPTLSGAVRCLMEPGDACFAAPGGDR